jgi:Zn-dependent peptidase ImmA (M78 family)
MNLSEADVITKDIVIDYYRSKGIIITFFSELLALDTLDNLMKVYGDDGCVTLDAFNNIIVALNDLKTNEELYSECRMLFSLCHEIAHIELCHFDSFFTKCYKKMERECNIFATNFLTPISAFTDFVTFFYDTENYLDATDIINIAEHFNISWTCCIIRLDELCIQEKKISDKLVSTYNARKAKSLSTNTDLNIVTSYYFKKGMM